MTDLPERVSITEEGPREGFQFEKEVIPTERKIELIEALAETGLETIQAVSFVNPKRVPGWADADQVVEGLRPREDVDYTALWLNETGLERAIGHRDKLALSGSVSMCASETFMRRNQNRGLAENDEVQARQIAICQANGVAVGRISVMAAFGCNFEGDVPPANVLEVVARGLDLAAAYDLQIRRIALADTMAWATPAHIKRVVGAVRERWPDAEITLHLHDTRGQGSRVPMPASRWACPASMPRSPASAAARSPATGARPATSAPRTSCSCARRWASRPGSIWSA